MRIRDGERDDDNVEEVIRYYNKTESRLGYALVLGGTKHFGYYSKGDRHWDFRSAVRTRPSGDQRGRRDAELPAVRARAARRAGGGGWFLSSEVGGHHRADAPDDPCLRRHGGGSLCDRRADREAKEGRQCHVRGRILALSTVLAVQRHHGGEIGEPQPCPPLPAVAAG